MQRMSQSQQFSTGALLHTRLGMLDLRTNLKTTVQFRPHQRPDPGPRDPPEEAQVSGEGSR